MSESLFVVSRGVAMLVEVRILPDSQQDIYLWITLQNRFKTGLYTIFKKYKTDAAFLYTVTELHAIIIIANENAYLHDILSSP